MTNEQNEIRRIEELYNLKRSKYKAEDLTESLERQLFNEAFREIALTEISLRERTIKL